MDKNESMLELYNELKGVPKNARIPIEEGRLKGRTSINPMWRIKKMTEVFGPAGKGWYIEVKKKWTEVADENTVGAFVDIDLHVKDPQTGEWLKPIHGSGGNTLVRKENSGRLYLNDEAYKMAETDAFSNACKKLGLGADIYFEQDTDKYTMKQSHHEHEAAPAATPAPAVRKTRERQASPMTALPELNELSPNWRASVAKAASMNVPAEEIRKRISSAFRINDDNFRKLMALAGKPITISQAS